MGQIKFGNRYGVASKPGRPDVRVGARVAVIGDERLRLGVLILTGVVTGFVAAAIECL